MPLCPPRKIPGLGTAILLQWTLFVDQVTLKHMARYDTLDIAR